ncbi:ATP-grasp domain-containing protein [Streptomyces sp. NPDC054766]|uniref:ATP-grasp domain-containing protein n=1 Tax=Streptomyces rhizosphaerihabitans TaxID=1266770 RepID=UPI0021BF6012|nr:ATP-grasp domain-containing protein [Streptomyces rhizosphaerihabitans]MCT9004767.1 ATP-grasp domain-containing protein [Streptomyces rhizosphaerihabitans]
MSRGGRTLAVVYDEGAASAGEIGVGLGDLGRVVFLVPDTPHNRLLRPVMENLGDVVALSGSSREDIDLVRKVAPDAVLTYSERMIRKTAELAEAMGLPSHSADVAHALTDKVRQRRILRTRGVDEVRSHPLRSPEEWPTALATVSLPAIIKPVQGGGSRDTYAVTTDAEAAEVLALLFSGENETGSTEFTVEELLEGRPSLPYGDYVSVESVCTEQGVVHLAVTGKFPLMKPFREPGRFWPAHVPEDEERAILDLTSRALQALDVTYGLTHTELKLTASGPRIIEINGRLTGHMNLTTRSTLGIDLVRLGGLLALGERPGTGPLDFGGQVHFQFNTMAPTQACRLERIHGATEVRRIPGVVGYRNYAKPGTAIPGGVMTYPLDVIWGTCDDHPSMIEVVRQALQALSYDFAFPGGPVRRITAEVLTNAA